MPPTALASHLTLARIKNLASSRSFSRGASCHADGAVSSLTEHNDTITATVRGTQKYTVRLTANTRDNTSAPALDYHCTCPFARDEGEFCKHCVAVALAWIESEKETPAGTSDIVKLDDLRPWLLAQPREKLADMLLETAARDRRLREQLLRHTALATGKQPDFNACRAAIRRATAIRGFVDWDETAAFASELHEIAGTLETFANDGFHPAVLELSEYALERINTHVAGNIDDSDGDMGFVCDQLLAIHHEAARRANTPPAQLAQRIHAWTLANDYGYFSEIIDRYAGLLGKTGLADLRARIEAELAKTAPGARNYAAEHALRAIARLTGDIEALVALETRDLSEPRAYLRAAEIHHAASQHDKALDWAERGLEKFSGATSPCATVALVDFLIAEYTRRRQHDKALALAWTHYEKSASLHSYRRLKETVLAASQNWPQWSERAVACMRRALDAAIAKRSPMEKTPPWSPRALPFADSRFNSRPHANYSELVRILLSENNTDAAWAAAGEKGCDETLWLELADKRAGKHPADAIPIYNWRVARLVEQTNNNAYEEALRILRKAKPLHARLNQAAEWESTLQTLRQTYRQKRNFIKLLATL